jgi:hypothetical protein
VVVSNGPNSADFCPYFLLRTETNPASKCCVLFGIINDGQSLQAQYIRTAVKTAQNLYVYLPYVVEDVFFYFDHFTAGRTPWTSDQLVARLLSKHRTTPTQNKHITHAQHPCRFLPCVGFEPTMPASERAKTIHALNRSATVTDQN